MKCQEVKRLLTDDELDRMDEIERHLADCESCRRLREDLNALKSLSVELKGQTKAPDFFATKVCSSVRPRRTRVAFLALAGSAAVAVAVCFSYLPSSTEAPERQAPSTVILAAEPAAPPAFGLRDDSGAQERLADSSSTVAVVVRQNSSAKYILEVPATIETRQTQAENEFYLKNVSH